MWDTPTFVIGLMAGLILMLIVVWALYAGRIFIFSICPKQRAFCRNSDYFNNPGNALADGARLKDILFINRRDQLLYKRVPKNSGCVPLSDSQTVVIKYPQHCLFRARDGRSYNGTNTEFGSRLYHLETSQGRTYWVLSDGDCKVQSSEDDFIVNGNPLLQWTPSHLLDD